MTDLTVNLDIRNSAQHTSTGFTNVPSSSGAMYAFKYSGGNDNGGNGNIVEIADGTVSTITIVLIADPRYTITGGEITGTQVHDVSFENVYKADGQQDNRKIKMKDTDQHEFSGEYTINIHDNVAGVNVPCDPSIRNRPSVGSTN